MITITKLKSDYFKVNEKYVKIRDNKPTLSDGLTLNQDEDEGLNLFLRKIESGLKISKTVMG